MDVILIAVAAVVFLVWRTSHRLAWTLLAVAMTGWYLDYSKDYMQLAGLITVCVVGYVVSIRINGRVAHGPCKGRGRYYGRFFTWRFRLCSGCGGNGRVVARSVRYFGTPRQQQELAAQVAAQRKARRLTERGAG